MKKIEKRKAQLSNTEEELQGRIQHQPAPVLTNRQEALPIEARSVSKCIVRSVSKCIVCKGLHGAPEPGSDSCRTCQEVGYYS